MSIEARTRIAVEEIKKAKEHYDQLVAKIGRDAVRSLFITTFKDHPELKGIVWTQFVSEYDDNSYSGGEDINELHAIIPEGLAKVFSLENNKLFVLDDKHYRAVATSALEKHLPAIANHLTALFIDLTCLKPILKSELGDSIMVLATRDGFELTFTENQYFYNDD